jgi:hypothetical protein
LPGHGEKLAGLCLLVGLVIPGDANAAARLIRDERQANKLFGQLLGFVYGAKGKVFRLDQALLKLVTAYPGESTRRIQSNVRASISTNHWRSLDGRTIVAAQDPSA